MNKKIIIAVLIVAAVLLAGYFLDEADMIYTAEEAEEIAESWVRDQAPTFTERDGQDLTHEETIEMEESVFEVIFNFEASFAGYGEVAEDEMAAQVITPHTTVVTVDSNEVVSAITDDVFDEMTGEMLGEDDEDDENDEEADEQTATVQLFFVDGEEVVSAERVIELTNGVEESAIVALLEGVTDEEEDEGYSSSIPEGVELLSFSLEDGVATVDFSSDIEPNGGSAWVTLIRDQIEMTLTQFDSVEEVVIMVEGDEEEVLQP